jgi:hypothetical protein
MKIIKKLHFSEFFMISPLKLDNRPDSRALTVPPPARRRENVFAPASANSIRWARALSQEISATAQR